MEHHGHIIGGWGDDDAEHKKTDESVIASTKATTFIGNEKSVQNFKPVGSDPGGSFGSETSYDPTIFGNDNTPTMLAVPPHPKLAFKDVPFEFDEPFQCPYCYTEQAVKNKSKWKCVQSHALLLDMRY